ncbi:MAG: hypothetical protein ACR2NR_18945 [Solirubrobacteraceae bacterium]
MVIALPRRAADGSASSARAAIRASGQVPSRCSSIPSSIYRFSEHAHRRRSHIGDDSGVVEHDRHAVEVRKRRDSAAQQHRHETDRDLIEQSVVETLLSDVRARDDH